MGIVRRHLTDDQKAAVALAWKEPLAKEARQAQVEGGKKAGKYRPSKVGENSRQAEAAPKPREPKTTQKLADLAEVSEHKIRQAEQVAAHAQGCYPGTRGGDRKSVV